jgi:hypothetical protein
MKLTLRSLTLALLAVSACWAQPQAPTNLYARSATKSAVQLAWTAGADASAISYVIERRPLASDPGAYAAIGRATTPSYTDSAIDPMQTYYYRVRGTDSGGKSSDGSNEVTIGPPPVGSSLISPVRPTLNFYDPTQFGVRPLMVLDSNGDPAVCYSVLSPNNVDGGDKSFDSFLEFVAWDRTQYAWKAPVIIGVNGDSTPTGGGSNSYSMARDASTNTWVVASVMEIPAGADYEIRLFVSTDNGATWLPATAFTDSANSLNNVSVALSGGVLHMSFYWDYNGIAYLTGKLSDPPSKWAASVAPLPGAAYDYRQENHLALDSQGKPGLAFFTYDGAYSSIVSYWRPGDGASTAVMDSNQIQNDFVEVKLAYFGTQARIAAQIVRDDQGPSGYDRFFWVAGDDGSANFAAPAGIPSDGNSDLAYGSLTLGSNGQAALVMSRTGGNNDGVRCGDPKIALSLDLVNWTVCSPYGANPQPYRDAYWPQAAYAVNDKLYIAMTNYDDSSPLYGVILWREP